MRIRISAIASVLVLTFGLCVPTQADSQRVGGDRIATFEATSIKRRNPGGSAAQMSMIVTP